MASDKSALGGTHGARGVYNEAVQLTWYMLLRFQEDPLLRAEIQTSEDATFHYSDAHPGGRATEFVQCKKVEAPQPATGDTSTDDWNPAPVKPSRWNGWVSSNRQAIRMLAADGKTFFTLLLFGIVDHLRRFVPGKPEWFVQTAVDSLVGVFDVHHMHSSDPAQVSESSTPESRRRLRVVPTASPDLLALLIARILESRYGIHKSRMRDAANAMIEAVRASSLEFDPESQVWTRKRAESLLAPFIPTQDHWIPAPVELRRVAAEWGNPLRGDSLVWSNFETGRFVPRTEWESAWSELQQAGFVVVSGPAGSGKTSAARWLAYRYLSEKQDAQAFFLAVKQGRIPSAARELIEQRLGSDTLFVLDVVRLAPDDVNRLVESFVHARMQGQVRARLVVVSAITHLATQSHRNTRRGGLLSHASQVRLPKLDAPRVRIFLNQFVSLFGIAYNIPLVEEIAALNPGSPALALHVLRYASSRRGAARAIRALGTRSNIANIIEANLTRGIPGCTRDRFRSECLPVLLIGATGIPIPKGFKSAAVLERLGWLEPADAGALLPTSEAMGDALMREHPDRILASICDLYAEAPGELYAITTALRVSGNNGILRKFTTRNQDQIVAQLGADSNPMPLREVVGVLREIRVAARAEALSILSRLIPKSAGVVPFFTRFVRAERVPYLRDVGEFCAVLTKVAGPRARRVARTELDALVETRGFARYLVLSVELDEPRLDELAFFLAELGRLSHRLSNVVLSSVRKTEYFDAAKRMADARPDSLAVWLQFCHRIRVVSRREAAKALSEHVDLRQVVNCLAAADRPLSGAILLNRLWRVRPVAAYEAARDCARDHIPALVSQFTSEPSLRRLGSVFATYGKVHRPTAARIFAAAKDDLHDRISRSGDYREIGYFIEQIARSVSCADAAAALESADHDRVVLSMLQENSAPNIVGFFLATVAKVAPVRAREFLARLRPTEFLWRIRPEGWALAHTAQLLKGMGAAAGPERPTLVEEIADDYELTEELLHRWCSVSRVEDHAHCLGTLLSAPFSSKEVRQMFRLEEDVFQRTFGGALAAEGSAQRVAYALHAAAWFDTGIAYTLAEQLQKRLGVASGDETPPAPETEIGGGLSIHHLAEVSDLLNALAMISRENARGLSKRLKWSRFVRPAISDPKLGQLSHVVAALNAVSRKQARTFIRKTNRFGAWKEARVENLPLAVPRQYAHALALVSRRHARRFVRYMLVEHGNELHEDLAWRADLDPIADWLHLARSLRLASRAEPIIAAADEAVEYDRRPLPLLRLCRSLNDCGHTARARAMADRALSNRAQLGYTRSLETWIDILHEAQGVSSRLEYAGFAEELVGPGAEAFHSAFAAEPRPLLRAYLTYLARTDPSGGWRVAFGGRERNAWEVSGAVRGSSHAFERLCALILTGGTTEEVRACAAEGPERIPLQRAYASLLYKSVAPHYATPETFPWNPAAGIDETVPLLTPRSADLDNLRFGLFLHLSAWDDTGSVELKKAARIGLRRARDEYRSLASWLLTEPPGTATLATRPLLLWRSLKEMFLRPSSLGWERGLERRVQRRYFR